ncbi:MAG: LysM peptidoglycan-binding domain-containing protein [Anaerolineaceae bacterium]|nr:LysM peptidoglycan-binding domain-containing protein [Anaerolineaceae bacterium]
MRRILYVFLVLSLCLPAAAAHTLPVQAAPHAEAPSPYDLIADVNSLRAVYGLPALEVNGYLMSSSQSYASYLISSGQTGHYADGTPDSRAANAGYPLKAGVDIQECWAAQYSNPNSSTAVYEQWNDDEHMAVMLHPNATSMGAGTAQGSDGRTIFILDVAVDFNSPPAKGTPLPTRNPNDTPIPGIATKSTRQYINPVITSTPNPDGRVVHVVNPGEAVWSIASAYNIEIQDLIRMNNLAATPVIFPGQKLVINPGPTITPTASATPTAGPPTATLRPTSTRLPPRPTRTLSVTHTPTPAPELEIGMNRRTIGLGLIVVCSIGLVIVFLSGLLGRKKKQE